MEWRNQVAVVTGGSRGIGRATARLLAQCGAAVCVNYATHADAAEALVAEITTAGGQAIAVVADVADCRIGEPEDIANAVVFLAAPESGWITAQVLTVDGGRMDYIGHG